MRVKGICPACGETVDCVRLHIAHSARKYLQSPDAESASYLCAEHPAPPGGRTGNVVDTTTGNVLREFCDGTLRPPKKFFMMQ